MGNGNIGSEVFVKIKEGFAEKSNYAWYSDSVGNMELATENTKVLSYNIVESYLVGNGVCFNDFFILKSIFQLSIGSAGHIYRMMNVLKKNGLDVHPVDPDGLVSRLAVFEKMALVYRFTFFDVNGKKNTVYTLTGTGLRVVKKYFRLDLSCFDKTSNEINIVDRMRHLAAAVVSVNIAKNTKQNVDIDCNGRLFPGGDKMEFYFSRVFFKLENYELYFEPVFLRSFIFASKEECKEDLLRRLRLFSGFFSHLETKKERINRRLVLIVEDKKMLDEVVVLLKEEMSEILSEILFTSPSVVLKVAGEICPLIFVHADTVSEKDGMVNYKSGLFDELDY